MPKGIYDRRKSMPRKLHSVETKKKISIANSGKSRSKEVRKEMSLSRKGKSTGPRLEITKKKISEANRGRHLSLNTEFKKGHKLIGSGIVAIIARPDYVFMGKKIQKGEHVSPSTEIKKGQSLSPKTQFKKGMVSLMKGRKHTLESRKKMSESLRNPNITDEMRRERIESRRATDTRLIDWRLSVYKRDNFTCVLCHQKESGNLNAHHKNGWAEYKEQRYDLENGVTLCIGCHMGFHRIYGKVKATTEKFNQFREQFINAGQKFLGDIDE